MTENRATQRKRTFKGGRIHLNHATTVDCVVRSVSDSGASLEIESPVGIPDAFAILISGESVPRDCRVAWRKQRRIGVKFAAP